MTTIEKPQTMSCLNTFSRWSSGEFATTRAPEVENGDESTTEDEMARAMIIPTSPTLPVRRNGTAKGMSAPRMPVVDTNADTTAPMKQMMSAAKRGAAIAATGSHDQSIVHSRSIDSTQVTRPQ